MPRTKVAIRARVDQLNEQLQLRRATAPSQADERRQLVQDCANNGGHVPTDVLNHTASAGVHVDHEVCQFCGAQLGASREQVQRNLTQVA